MMDELSEYQNDLFTFKPTERKSKHQWVLV